MRRGADNPNYRHGKHVDPRCECGRPKDYRSKRCSMCSGVSQPITGEIRYTHEEMRAALLGSRSLSEAARNVGLSRHTVTLYAQTHDISLAHMRASRGRPATDETVFRVWEKRDNGSVRRYLRLAEPEEYQCAICDLPPEWNGRTLTLQMDHINGNRCDNRRANLRWLCPNCHSQTDTYTGRNRGKGAPA